MTNTKESPEYLERFIQQENMETNTSPIRPSLPVPHMVWTFIEKVLDGPTEQIAIAGHAINAEHLSAIKQLYPDSEVTIFSELDACQESGDQDHTLVLGDPIIKLSASDSRFDQVLCFPSWGLPPQKRSIKLDKSSIDLIDCQSGLLTAVAVTQLTEEGVCISLSERSLFLKTRSNSFLMQLDKLNMNIRCSIDIPNGSFAPMTSLGGCLLLVAPGVQSELFVGELPSNEAQVEVLAKNFIQKKEGKLIESGCRVSLASYSGLEALRNQKAIESYAETAGISLHPAKLVIVDCRLPKQSSPEPFVEIENAIYLPKLGASDAVQDWSQATIKPQNLLQLEINVDIARPEYLEAFFNTETGMEWRKSVTQGAIIPQVSKARLMKAQIPLPPMEIQEQLLSLDSRARLLESRFNKLRAKAWQSPKGVVNYLGQLEKYEPADVIRSWADELPYPLATILWRYLTISESRYKSKYECLLHFFEAYTEFICAILLSSLDGLDLLMPGSREKVRDALEKAHQGLKTPSFGTWKTILESTFKQIRRNNNPDNRESIQRVFALSSFRDLERLISKRFISAINNAIQWRNAWHGHGGVVSQVEAKKRHDQLEKLLIVLRNEHTFWDSYQLVQPMGAQVTEEGIEYEVGLVQGRSFPFEKRNRFFVEHLNTKEGWLYIAAEGQTHALKLLPFIIFSPGPASADNACYFYNRIEKGKHKYISYHFEKESEIYLEQDKSSADIAFLFSEIK